MEFSIQTTRSYSPSTSTLTTILPPITHTHTTKICKDNTINKTCQVHITENIAKQNAGLKPGVYFYIAIYNTILQHVIQEASSSSASPSSTTHLAATRLISKLSNFWPLVNKCNLNFRKHNDNDEGSQHYNKTILSAFRDLVE